MFTHLCQNMLPARSGISMRSADSKDVLPLPFLPTTMVSFPLGTMMPGTWSCTTGIWLCGCHVKRPSLIDTAMSSGIFNSRESRRQLSVFLARITENSTGLSITLPRILGGRMATYGVFRSSSLRCCTSLLWPSSWTVDGEISSADSSAFCSNGVELVASSGVCDFCARRFSFSLFSAWAVRIVIFDFSCVSYISNEASLLLKILAILRMPSNCFWISLDFRKRSNRRVDTLAAMIMGTVMGKIRSGTVSCWKSASEENNRLAFKSNSWSRCSHT